MASLYTHSDSNKRKTWAYLAGFFVFIIIVGYIFSVAMEDSSILYIAVIFSIVANFFAYYNSDKMVLMMSQAHEIDHDSNRELYHLVENLCITAGLPTPKIYIIDDTAPNAFATGRDPKHAVIAVTSGLLQKLDKAELEGVIAHELSHIGNRDILLSTVVTVLVGLVVLLADWFRHWSFFGGRRSNSENNQLQLIITIVAIVLSILAPVFAYMLQFAISRKREFAADADGALLTRYPEGLARALEKISADREPLEVANRATAHLYIASPFKETNRIGWLTRMLATHPPVEERIKKLRGLI
ncbi:MAG: M48 family metallopeptidase [Candidatus Falkowbacteria bacterium]|nr:MAG: M48 family metallopeptidase [Candidatus Falkowbacteria bacterium]